MKKKHFLSLIIVFIIVLSPILIKADSGFDSSWDSGSSWGGSSDWSSSSNYSSGSYYSGVYFNGASIITTMILTFIIFVFYQSFRKKINNNALPKIIMFPPYFIFIFFIFGFINLLISIITLIILLTESNKNNNSNQLSNIPSRLSQEDIHKYLPNLNIEEFNNIVFNIYKDIQEAWMSFNLDTIRNLVSNEIYNMYSMQLNTLKIKGQKNMMENIKYINNYISNISTENNITTIQTVLTVTCNDYVIDSNNKVVRGNKNRTMTYTYILTFTKYNNDQNITNCPNCGAKININSSGQCEYCNSNIINKEEKWIMTKKQMSIQK